MPHIELDLSRIL